MIMKKILYLTTSLLMVAVLMVACTSRTSEAKIDEPAIKVEDTAGLADFQAWKAMNERQEYLEYKQWQAEKQMAVTTVAATPRTSAPRKASSTSGTMSSESTNYARTTTKKKGWSKAAKYSAIGGGGGILLGAVINKRNRVAGGIVGGVLGGGLGYILGRSQDKKDGRY
jgi:hypothetical protein